MTRGIGTPEWMAPEIILLYPYDLKSDVYSFAIVLYEIIAETIPYYDN